MLTRHDDSYAVCPSMIGSPEVAQAPQAWGFDQYKNTTTHAGQPTGCHPLKPLLLATLLITFMAHPSFAQSKSPAQVAPLPQTVPVKPAATTVPPAAAI